MSVDVQLGAALACGLAAYLIVALFWPERLGA